MLQIEILKDKREKGESEETKQKKETDLSLKGRKQILVKRKENVPHTVSCKNQTRKEY